MMNAWNFRPGYAALLGLGALLSAQGCIGGKVADAVTGAALTGVSVEVISGSCKNKGGAACASRTQTTRTIVGAGLTFSGAYVFDAYGDVNGTANVQKVLPTSPEQAIALRYTRTGYQPAVVWHVPEFSSITVSGKDYLYSSPRTVYLCSVGAVDSDSDGLCDAAEARLGTDRTSRDSDVDGLGDLVDAYGYSSVEYAACTDGVKNNGETAVDCGGRTCRSCSNTKTCSAATDCASGTCSAGVCRAALPWWMKYCSDAAGTCSTPPVVRVCPDATPNCAPTRSTTVVPEIDGQRIDRINMPVTIPAGYSLQVTSGTASVSGNWLTSYRGAIRVLSDVAVLFTYYGVPAVFGGTTHVNFRSAAFTSPEVLTTVYRHPSYLTGNEPSELHARGRDVIAHESALSNIRPGQMHAYFLPAELVEGEGNFSDGNLNITSNYGNPPYIAANGDVYAGAMPRFAHEYAHELFSEIRASYPGNHGCFNEGLADAFAYTAGFMPEDEFGPSGQLGTDFDDGCAETMVHGEVHEVGNCPLWQVKRLGRMTESFTNALLHPQKVIDFDSCDLSVARTGNALIVLFSDAAGMDMTQAIQMAEIPNAGSYAAARTALGI